MLSFSFTACGYPLSVTAGCLVSVGAMCANSEVLPIPAVSISTDHGGRRSTAEFVVLVYRKGIIGPNCKIHRTCLSTSGGCCIDKAVLATRPVPSIDFGSSATAAATLQPSSVPNELKLGRRKPAAQVLLRLRIFHRLSYRCVGA